VSILVGWWRWRARAEHAIGTGGRSLGADGAVPARRAWHTNVGAFGTIESVRADFRFDGLGWAKVRGRAHHGIFGSRLAVRASFAFFGFVGAALAEVTLRAHLGRIGTFRAVASGWAQFGLAGTGFAEKLARATLGFVGASRAVGPAAAHGGVSRAFSTVRTGRAQLRFVDSVAAKVLFWAQDGVRGGLRAVCSSFADRRVDGTGGAVGSSLAGKGGGHATFAEGPCRAFGGARVARPTERPGGTVVRLRHLLCPLGVLALRVGVVLAAVSHAVFSGAGNDGDHPCHHADGQDGQGSFSLGQAHFSPKKLQRKRKEVGRVRGFITLTLRPTRVCVRQVIPPPFPFSLTNARGVILPFLPHTPIHPHHHPSLPAVTP
jgi:hypothetical protein